MKVAPSRLGEIVNVASLHEIVDGDLFIHGGILVRLWKMALGNFFNHGDTGARRKINEFLFNNFDDIESFLVHLPFR